jgi:16S rRNA (uracil1498-N3)-methyltransferase
MSGHAPFFYVDPAALDAAEISTEITLDGEDARHLAVVRRAVPGDAVRISDGKGRIVEARLLTVKPVGVTAAVTAQTRSPAPSPGLEVLQGLAKGDKVDGVIRDLTEMGVDRVGIFEADRSVARWDGARRDAAARRWETIAREAAKQSHRAWLPALAGPLSLAEATAGREGLGLVAHPAAGVRLGDVLAERCGATGTRPAPVAVWVAVGPEGGLSDAEVAAFVSAGGVPVSLGEQVLRTETASVIVAAIVLHRFGRLG